jgi:hypothetical protein
MSPELTQIGLYALFLAAGWVIRHQGWFVPSTPQPASTFSQHPVLDEILSLLRQVLDQQNRTPPATPTPPRQGA